MNKIKKIFSNYSITIFSSVVVLLLSLGVFYVTSQVSTTTIGQNITVQGTLETSSLKVTGGTPGVGKVLTSDSVGLASWESQYIPVAWVNFNGIPATPIINGAGNVGSVTKLATGNYRINFSTVLSDTNYAIIGTADNYSETNPNCSIVVTNKTTSYFEIYLIYPSTQSTKHDAINVNFVIFQ